MKSYVSIFSLLLILFSCSSNNNFRIKNIHEINPIFPQQKYEFPLLVGSSSEITGKINSDIILDFLEVDINIKHESIFEKVWGTKEYSIPKLSDLTYNVNTISKKIFSITFNAEGCGSYCENFSTSYNYDLESGNKIYLDSLFTNKGKETLLIHLTETKRKIIKEYIFKIKNENIKEEDKEQVEQTITLYEYCLKNLPFVTLKYFDFKVTNNTIILTSDRCSNHVNRALDDLGKYKFILEKNKIINLLNNFGNEILINDFKK